MPNKRSFEKCASFYGNFVYHVQQWYGNSVKFCDSLRAGQSGDRTKVWASYSGPVQTVELPTQPPVQWVPQIIYMDGY